MASSGTITIDVSACDSSGFGITGNPSVPSHGTAAANVLTNQLFYTNNGDGTTVDHFRFFDDNGQPVNVTVNVAASIAPIANAVNATVAYGSSANAITLNFTGASATSVAVATSPQHGSALASGTAITYTPTTGYAGADSFTYRGTNTAGTSAAASVTITVSAPTLVFAPASPPNGARGAAYSHVFTAASGGAAPYTYVLNGALPAGLTFNGATRTLAGTPSSSGSYPITITATDSSGGTNAPFSKTSGPLTLVILAVPDAPGIGNASAGDAQATVDVTAPTNNGGSAITTYTATANPGGAIGTRAGPSGGPITVTGLTNGTSYTFRVTATNSTGTSLPSPASASVTPKSAQTITFTNPGPRNFGTSPSLVGIATSGLGVRFSTTTPGVCTVSGPSLVTVAPGTCTVDANQDGDTAWLPAPQVTQSFAIVVPGGAVSIVAAGLPNAVGGTAYSQTIVATGGSTPYVFTIAGGSLPAGVNLSPTDGGLTGTPLVAGTFNFTVHVTDAATQFADQAFTLIVDAPGVTVSPASLPAGMVGTAYTQTLTASGGTAPYTYAVTTGSLPSGLTLSSLGSLSGTATTAVAANFTVTVTDSLGFNAGHAYALVMGDPAPATVDDNATTGANAVATVPVTTNDSGPITGIAIAQVPTHGTATIAALAVIYTPAHDYFGTDTLTYTANGPGGTSAPATVTITVVAGTVPVAMAQSANVLGGKSVTIHAANGATNGPFTVLTIVAQPASGSVAVQGTDAVYTAAADASGSVTFDFTLGNAFGTSAAARATVDVNPVPVAASLSATALAGTTVQVDLTMGARGGPFNAANVLTIVPANAGSATVQATATGYSLFFAAAATFSGSASVGYTLTNAYATSAPGSIAIAVTARSDPSKDAEVVGILSAQADATRRMATGQISNFQRRLEMLHSGGLNGFSNGISFASAGSQRGKDPYAALHEQREEWNRRYLVQPDPDASPQATGQHNEGGSLPGDVAVWTGGAVNFGKSQASSSGNGTDFTTSGLSFGMDKQFSPNFAMGAGVGYGHDNSDIGDHGSRSSVDSYNVALYASYRPTDSLYTDALIGYQWLSFDARRYLTDTGGRVHGSRDGKQLFGSFSMGYLYRVDGTQLTPYGRVDIARAHLDGYTESGDDIYALSYQRQTVKTSTVTLGLLAQWTVKRDYGVWAPQLRAEFGHDMQGSSQAAMRYADLLDGPLYRATLQQQSREHTLLGAGIVLQTLSGWLLRAEYQLQLDNSTRDNQSILLGLEKKFDP